MILRRVIEHVKAQNWTAVALDFLIVVIGVFIGIQLGNWNAARTDRNTEKIYLQRLMQELAEMGPASERTFSLVREREELLRQVMDNFETGNVTHKLTGRHCAALVRSHIMAGVIYYPPTIKELIATGRIVLLRAADLRTAILSFDESYEAISQLRADIQIDRMILSRQHADLIEFGFYDWEASVCDFKAMASDRQFLNDFADNHRRFSAYTLNVEGAQAEMISTLKTKVAASLGQNIAQNSADISYSRAEGK